MLDLIWATRDKCSRQMASSTSIYDTLAPYGIYKYAINSEASTIHINMIETLVSNLWNGFRFRVLLSVPVLLSSFFFWFVAFCSLSLNRI